MRTETVIRRLTDGDIGLLLGFFLEIDQDQYRRNFSPHSFTEKEALRICSHQGDDRYLGMITLPENIMVGYGLLRGIDEGYSVPSLGLCISKAYQGKGLGHKLLSYLLNECEKNNYKQAMLKVKKNNYGARHLYEQAGFTFSDFNTEFLIGYKNLNE